MTSSSSGLETRAARTWLRHCSLSVQRAALSPTRRAAMRLPMSEPTVIEAMAELGIDLSEAYAKPLSPEVLAASDRVIASTCTVWCHLRSTSAARVKATRGDSERIGRRGTKPCAVRGGPVGRGLR